MAEPKNTFVVGWPIKQSRSPLIHNHWIDVNGLKGNYCQHPVQPEHIENFLTTLPTSKFVGGNITIPHKETAFRLIDCKDAEAKRIGAVNTVWLEKGRLYGSNTDGYGFLANLDEMSPGWDRQEARQRGALILGAGGAARAVVDAVYQRGFETIFIVNRTTSKAVHLRNQLAPNGLILDYTMLSHHHKQVSLIVNTTSIGMGDDKQPISLDGFQSDTIVNDIIYAPLHTPLLLEAKQRGMKVVDGLGMLLHQAVPGFEKWFGKRPDVTPQLRNILLADLGEKS